MQSEEKKVEFIELIYDLVFVYFIGRNNELLHHTENGFFTFGVYLNFLLGILIIIQIWYTSTVFINRYGDNSVKNFIALFINMYLIYFMADGTRLNWGDYYIRYNVAWGLILVNLAIQYLLQLKTARTDRPWELPYIKRHALLLLIQAGIIFASIPLYNLFHFPLSWVSLIAGFAFIIFTHVVDSVLPVNFEHLTERVMLFVVFTFGEMIISISAYFTEAFNLNTLFYTLMIFLIVAGLFLSYGYLYNHVIDRGMTTNGIGYMLLHVMLLVALFNITAALVFMREPDVDVIPKTIMLVASYLVYFFFLLLIGKYSKEGERLHKSTVLLLSLTALAFVLIMLFFYHNPYVSIIASVLYIYGEHLLMVRNHKLSGID